MAQPIARIRNETSGFTLEPGRTRAIAQSVAAFEDPAPISAAKLKRVYALLLCGRLHLNIHENRSVRRVTVHLALGIDCNGAKDIVGIGVIPAFVSTLRDRGVEHIFVSVSETDDAAMYVRGNFPNSSTQVSIAHLIRHSLSVVSKKDRAAVSIAMRSLYRAPDLGSGNTSLKAFADGRWGQRYPSIAANWRKAWQRLDCFFDLPVALRRFLETADAAGSFQEKLQRRALYIPGHFASEEAALAQLADLARKCTGEWKVAPRKWQPAKTHFHALCARSGLSA